MQQGGNMRKFFCKTKAAAGILLVIMALAVFNGPSCFDTRPKPWSFGVMSDTHWSCPTDPEGINPSGVAISVINQVNAEFIDKGVKFVIQVGDLINVGGDHEKRAVAAQALYDKGIGFFPMRGNHDIFAAESGIPAILSNFPQTRGLSNTYGTYHFSSPKDVSAELDGMSYAFDYGTPWNSATFVVIDEWGTPGKSFEAGIPNYFYGYSVGEQQAWISSRLDKNTRMTTHAFVFAHHNLMPEYHYDCLFTGFADSNIDMQNSFYASLQDNGVKYFTSGHEHFYNRSMVTSPDGLSKVQDLICASAGSKFLAPKDPASANFHGQKIRQMQIAQELKTVGYFIYTVDGPRVTVEYYSDDHGNWLSDALYPTGANPVAPFINQVTPDFNFVKKDTWGYSLNGNEFIVAQDQDYTAVADFYCGTKAKILSGFNGSDTVDAFNRPFTKVVNTGWETNTDWDVNSNILTLWGMSGLGTDETDTYALSMTYTGKEKHINQGRFGIATMDSDDRWVNAVDMNYGGTKKFVKGPWKPEYGLGTYGVDTRSNTAWAVLNYNAQFAVAQDI
jgi:hypothetical protein